MRNTARLTALAILLVVAGCSNEDDDRDAPRLISVSGEGEVVVAPDRATLALSIAARHKDLAAAQAEADAVVAKLMKVTAGLGMRADHLIALDPELGEDPLGIDQRLGAAEADEADSR